MIRIFGVDKPSGENFIRNGDIVVQPTKAIIHKYENSDFYLEIEVSIEYLDYFQEGRIIVADVPWLSGSFTTEIFRIGNVSVNHNKITSKCMHITYDLDWFIPNNRGFSYHGQVEFNETLRFFYTAQGASGYGRFTRLTIPDSIPVCNAFLDTTKTNPASQSMLSFIKAVMNNNNLFFNRRRDTFYCTNSRVETETDIILEYAKNIRTFQKSESWDETVQQIRTFINGMAVDYQCPDAYAYYPTGYDKNSFIKYAKFIEFKSRLDPNDYASSSDYNAASVADIEQQINDYFKEHGKPKINYTLNAYVENVIDLGYKIKVIDKQMGVEVMTSVLGFKYNLLTETYTEVSFGNYKESMKNYNYKTDNKFINLSNSVGSIAYPIGSIFTTGDSNQNPNSLSGFDGYWELQSSSGGIYTWKRLA